MKKTKQFKKGDKVFAKLKGYPPWPALIVGNNGKKYNVKFYGTGEIGLIKSEDLFYYLRHKKQFVKPLKRKDYNDALEEIEKAVKKDGDGDVDDSAIEDNSNTSLDSSTIGERKKSIVERKSSIGEMKSPVADKRTPKRKRTVGDKSETSQSPKKKSGRLRSSIGTIEVSEKSNGESKPRTRVKAEVEERTEDSVREEHSVPAASIEETFIKEEAGALTNINGEETAYVHDTAIKILPEKTLKIFIAYAKHVKENADLYKGRPVEEREDFVNHVLPVILPPGTVAGIKLHKDWPLKHSNEYDRALYDGEVAIRCLDDKDKLLTGEKKIDDDTKMFVGDIQLTEDEIFEKVTIMDIENKKRRIERLKVEANLTALDASIKSCLGLDGADPLKALGHLKQMHKINFDELMLKKHAHVIEMVRRLRKYVGNTQEWGLNEEALAIFEQQAEKVRQAAERVYSKFKTVVKVADDTGSFWDAFRELLTQFRTKCKDLTEEQVYVLCAEPQSRKAFMDNEDELMDIKSSKPIATNDTTTSEVNSKDTEKENSSEAANSENKTTEKVESEDVLSF